MPGDDLEQRHDHRRLRIFAQPVDHESQQQVTPGLRLVRDRHPHRTSGVHQIPTVAIHRLLELGQLDPLRHEVPRQSPSQAVDHALAELLLDIADPCDVPRPAEQPEPVRRIDRAFVHRLLRRIDEQASGQRLPGAMERPGKQPRFVRPEPTHQLHGERVSIGRQRPKRCDREASMRAYA